ncbi:unnamed protein product [Bemisia tabaci]|uniref:CHK kinase-like domain-containing protein n=1 Tax=Bemisia tabaci TaxID=7038 RepID=A0A9P0CC37_BEMTA|nr:unnamed protein product [Bemisia tabaci]
MDLIQRLNSVVFPEAVEAGGFGDDVEKFVSFEPNDNKGTDQFCSEPVFGQVVLEKKTGERFVQPVLVKAQSSAEFPPQEFSDYMFHNEVLFYTRIIPLFRKYDKCNVLSSSFPEFVYGKGTIGQRPTENILVMKDLRQKGFEPCRTPYRLDEDHLELVLHRLGKFHALSLICKLEDPAGYEAVNSRICAGEYSKGVCAFGGVVTEEAFRDCMFRGIEPLRNDSDYKDRLADLCANCEEPSKWLDKYALTSEPLREPLSVINHGDFHINNMMFKYQDDGKPSEVAFFDLAVIRNATPAVDLSVMFLFGVDPDIIRKCWSNVLHVYHDALSSQMGDHREKPSFETVELDLRKKGIFAYYILACCSPKVMDVKEGINHPPPPELEGLDDDQLKATIKEHIRELRRRGGTVATELLAEIVRVMIDKKFIFEH